MAKKFRQGFWQNGVFVALEDVQPDPNAKPSKTALKAQSQEAQDLGEALITIKPHRVDALELPDNLRAAIAEGQSITAHGAKRRHLQYIGKLMRTVDLEPVRALIAAVKAGR